MIDYFVSIRTIFKNKVHIEMNKRWLEMIDLLNHVKVFLDIYSLIQLLLTSLHMIRLMTVRSCLLNEGVYLL